MTNPVTPNIGLNKIDRTSPSTTYFDLEKYIDQNADAVDRFAGETSASIDALEKRLDTEERREVVLQPGLQIVNAERSAPFKLSGIKGRTLVNLAGRKSYVSNNDPSIVTLNVAVNSIYNNTDTINVDIKNTNEGYIVYKQVSNSHYSIDTGKYYVISADVKINSISGTGQIKVGGTVEGATDADKTKIGVWQRVYHTIKVGSNNALNIIIGTCYAAGVFATANFDIKNISFYEISQVEDTIFRTLSPEQRNIKYPYVNSVTPVRNPYAIRYGENLAPTLFEGTVERSTKMLSEYSALVKATGETVVEYRSNLIPAIPNTKYTLRAIITHNGIEKYNGVYVDVLGYDEAGLYVLDTPGTSVGGTGTGTDTFATPANIKTMEVRIVAPQDAAVGDYVVEDITLNLGATVRTHKPREDCILTLQTDLFADPLTDANADEVFEKDGQYFKLAKWKHVVIDNLIGNFVIPINQGNVPRGAKIVYIQPVIPDGSRTNAALPAFMTKFDGKIMKYKIENNALNTFDDFLLNTAYQNKIQIVVSDTDSGWGDNYTPTADEIRAYFMGWKMYDGSGSAGVPYNGTGLKAWVNLVQSLVGNRSNWTTTLPTTPAVEWTPYQLVYQLATPTVEPIVSEGMLKFNEGDNQIEVGTGIVVRESVKPYRVPSNGNTVINSTYPGEEISKTKMKVDKFLYVYENGMTDNTSWTFERHAPYAYGIERLYMVGGGRYDPAAAYSVTYLTLDKSPIVSFSGSYAANEKVMLQELTDAVQQKATAVSVLMNKKVDKDASVVWITPTLLNGWNAFNSSTHFTFGFSKDSEGFVHGRGLITGGVGNVGTVIAKLPPGYRPIKILSFPTLCLNGTAPYPTIIDINPNGDVIFSSNAYNTSVMLYLPPFLAEQ
ncbi:hypothetical protein MHI43_27150 [Paenibacillus sp. FSL H8-0457]|uniref:hypothetical protein n=1 Tax=unclassified Paenibacillus TaxID=185978 RepID=UPI0003E22CDD|nr:hypothetical protein [Paenibacillus sp. FSL H8-457]ETT58712.1 hypothetical protein C172_26040 [Paenibacillus sp. FSL H8-457]